MKSTILVVGSSNTDMVVKTNRFPASGETILGGNFFMNAGGKGANQAVAAVRLGAKVKFVCKVGRDIFGEQAVRSFETEGIDISGILVDEQKPSGVALILVDGEAENMIVVAPGANEELEINDAIAADLTANDFLLMQLEVPLHTVTEAAVNAKQKGATVILNPAPAANLPEILYQNIDVITPNEKEAAMLAGLDEYGDINSAKQAAIILHKKGVAAVVITLGAKGALIYENEEFIHVEGQVVKAVDTTAAGDVFNGALVVALSEGNTLVEAVNFACKASAISVTRLGAQASAPRLEEVLQLN